MEQQQKQLETWPSALSARAANLCTKLVRVLCVETAFAFTCERFFSFPSSSFLQNFSTAFPSYNYKMRARIAAQTCTAKPPLF